MSVVNTGAARRSSEAGLAIFANVFATLNSWNDRRITRSSLSKLTDRQLDDIGLCRGDIDRIARRPLGQ